MTTPAPWQPRLIAVDIDGTLCAEGTDITVSGPEAIRPAVRSALGAASAGGAQVVLCTGRTVIGLRPFLAALALSSGWAIGSNGAVLLDAVTGAVARTVTFDPAEPARVLRKLLPEAVFIAEQVGVGNRSTAGMDVVNFFGETTVVDFDTLISHSTPRMSMLWPGHNYAELAKVLAGVEIPGVHYSLDHSEACLMATPPGVTKGSALESLRVELGIASGDTMAVGDSFNDIEMLAWAAHGVAMGQAPDQVKAVANEVTAPVGDDGLAKAVRRWFPQR